MNSTCIMTNEGHMLNPHFYKMRAKRSSQTDKGQANMSHQTEALTPKHPYEVHTRSL